MPEPSSDLTGASDLIGAAPSGADGGLDAPAVPASMVSPDPVRPVAGTLISDSGQASGGGPLSASGHLLDMGQRFTDGRLPDDAPALDGAHVRTSGSGRRRPIVRPVVRGILVYALFCALLGAVSGMVWHAAVRLPHYVVSSDGGAATTERGLTRFFVTDAWFCLVGLLCGLLLGTVAWWLFRRLGWVVTIIALAGSMIGALVAWRVGTALGPHHFAQRVSRASAGAQVPIDFQLRSTAALLVWPLASDLAVLLFSALGRDADDLGSRARRWARSARRRPQDTTS